jgi:hypothetical protein
MFNRERVPALRIGTTSRFRWILWAALTLLSTAVVWREVRVRPGPRARVALALYGSGVRLGERVGPLAVRWPGLTVAGYEGLRDRRFTARDGFADLYLLVDGMEDNSSERPPDAGARVRGLKLRTASVAGAATAMRRLTQHLGPPRVQCWGVPARPVLSWRDPGGGGVALSIPPAALARDAAGQSSERAMLLVAAYGLARELQHAGPCGPRDPATPV